MDDLPSYVRFMFISVGKSAVCANNNGLSKQEFITFCIEMWNTMEINGAVGFSDTLDEIMKLDIAKEMGNDFAENFYK